MADLITPVPPEEVAADPRDRGSSYTWAWLAWMLVFGILEAKALHDDNHSPDRVKRTLSSNLRWWFATDSITGIPVNVKFGKLRRLALIWGMAWFAKHIQQNGAV